MIQRQDDIQNAKQLSKDRVNLGAVEAGQRQQPALPALDRGVQKRQKGKGGVEVVVTIIACRRVECDDDGAISAAKPLRDAIAHSLGMDDGDRRIRWEYGQCETRGAEGVIVKIERL
jgi:hypothetical protein